MENQQLSLAGKEVRFINFFIDMIAFFIIWIAISIILILIGFDQAYTDETGEVIPLIPMFAIAPVFWGYYIISEYFFNKTLGKLITKTRIVTKSGTKPSIGQVIGRSLCRSIPFEYISYIITVKGIHDYLSGTRIIKESQYQEDLKINVS